MKCSFCDRETMFGMILRHHPQDKHDALGDIIDFEIVKDVAEDEKVVCFPIDPERCYRAALNYWNGIGG